MTTQRRMPVWEVVDSISSLGRDESIQLCKEFIDAQDLDVSVDDCADESPAHIEFVNEMYDILYSDLKYHTTVGNRSIMMRNGADDPFYYKSKVPINDIDRYLSPVDYEYHCTICGENHKDNGYQLSCKNKSCTFCHECITPWITESIAKCPNCVVYITTINCKTNDFKSKPKIVIKKKS